MQQKGAVSSRSPQPVITQEQLDRSSPERGSGLWEEVQWEQALRPATVTVIRVRETSGRSFFFLFKMTVMIYVKEMLLFERN